MQKREPDLPKPKSDKISLGNCPFIFEFLAIILKIFFIISFTSQFFRKADNSSKLDRQVVQSGKLCKTSSKWVIASLMYDCFINPIAKFLLAK